MRINRSSAFTLIELAIVLAVIGLIVAVVVSGTSLVRTAKSRATLAQVNSFKTAMNTFRAQYDAIPGDMSNASSFWGSTNNGNGNVLMGDGNEPYLFWQHLALAGLIAGTYSGTASAAPPIPGVDNPVPAHNKEANFLAWYHSSIYSRVSPTINISSSKSGCSNTYWCGGATLSDVTYWETKEDDRDAGRGNIVTLSGWDTGGYCASDGYPGNLPGTYVYSNDNGGMNCWVMFFLQ